MSVQVAGREIKRTHFVTLLDTFLFIIFIRVDSISIQAGHTYEYYIDIMGDYQKMYIQYCQYFEKTGPKEALTIGICAEMQALDN